MSNEYLSKKLAPALLDELVEVEFPDSSDATLRFRVYMTHRVKETYDEVNSEWRAQCEEIMGFYGRDGPYNLKKEDFRAEGRYHTGGRRGRKIMICAFKAYQLRVYGAKIPNVDCFVCTEIDPAKKKRKVDVARLRRAARKLGRFI